MCKIPIGVVILGLHDSWVSACDAVSGSLVLVVPCFAGQTLLIVEIVDGIQNEPFKATVIIIAFHSI